MLLLTSSSPQGVLVSEVFSVTLFFDLLLNDGVSARPLFMFSDDRPFLTLLCPRPVVRFNLHLVFFPARSILRVSLPVAPEAKVSVFSSHMASVTPAV